MKLLLIPPDFGPVRVGLFFQLKLEEETDSGRSLWQIPRVLQGLRGANIITET